MLSTMFFVWHRSSRLNRSLWRLLFSSIYFINIPKSGEPLGSKLIWNVTLNCVKTQVQEIWLTKNQLRETVRTNIWTAKNLTYNGTFDPIEHPNHPQTFLKKYENRYQVVEIHKPQNYLQELTKSPVLRFSKPQETYNALL